MIRYLVVAYHYDIGTCPACERDGPIKHMRLTPPVKSDNLTQYCCDSCLSAPESNEVYDFSVAFREISDCKWRA